MGDLDGRTAADRWLGGMSAPDGGYTQLQREMAGEVLLLLERLRAKVERMECVVDAARDLRELMAVEFDDERLDYVTIQVDREALAAFGNALAAGGGE